MFRGVQIRTVNTDSVTVLAYVWSVDLGIQRSEACISEITPLSVEKIKLAQDDDERLALSAHTNRCPLHF